MIQTLLLGTDESSEASAALDWAAVLAEATGALVTIAEAYLPEQAELTPQHADERRRAIQTRLATWTSARWPGHLPAPRTLAVRGDALAVLCGTAEDLDADIVVIGSKPVEGVTSLGLGSLAHGLAHHLRRPLVIVPAASPPAGGGSIIADLETSGPDDDLLEWCNDLADDLGAVVHEVHEAPPSPKHAKMLHDIASGRGASLIVVAAPEDHLLSRHPLGAVADRLLHHPVHAVAILPHPVHRRHSVS
jgi:nucleotide-binding universal stress UspA family protein